MCGSVTVADPTAEHGERTLGSLGELRQNFTVLPEDADDECSDEWCLCCVNVRAVLERTGQEWWEGCCSDWRLRSMIADPDDGWWIRKINTKEAADAVNTAHP